MPPTIGASTYRFGSVFKPLEMSSSYRRVSAAWSFNFDLNRDSFDLKRYHRLQAGGILEHLCLLLLV
jgi:hypothetical protein